MKLYVSMPKSAKDPYYRENLRVARQRGVGVLEIENSNGEIILEALSISLTGCRPINRKSFQPKYRSKLAEAEGTFRNGSPAQGCLIIYEEIEHLCRNIAKKTRSKGFWKPPKKGRKSQKMNLDKGPWAKIMEILMENLDYKKCASPDLKQALFARILGITPHRLDSAHKPKTRNALIKRDRELRTRFESASDILEDLIKASKPLRV